MLSAPRIPADLHRELLRLATIRATWRGHNAEMVDLYTDAIDRVLDRILYLAQT